MAKQRRNSSDDDELKPTKKTKKTSPRSSDESSLEDNASNEAGPSSKPATKGKGKGKPAPKLRTKKKTQEAGGSARDEVGSGDESNGSNEAGPSTKAPKKGKGNPKPKTKAKAAKDDDDGEGGGSGSEGEEDGQPEAPSTASANFLTKSQGQAEDHDTFLEVIETRRRSSPQELQQALLARQKELAPSPNVIIDEDGVEWQPSRGYGAYMVSPDGTKRFILLARPQPTLPCAERGQTWTMATAGMMKDFVARRFILRSYKDGELPDWVQAAGFATRLEQWLVPLESLQGDSRVKFFAIAHDLNSLSDINKPSAAWLRARRQHSVKGLVEAGYTPEELAKLLKNVVYIEFGLKKVEWSTVYGGKSNDMGRRNGEHEAAHAKWQILGLHLAPLHYQQAGDCEERLIFPWAQISDLLSPAMQAEGLSVYEWAVVWGLGCYTLKQDLLDARAERGLPALVGVRGVNGTSAVDGTHNGETFDGSHFGVQNADYNLLRRFSYSATAIVVLADAQVALAHQAVEEVAANAAGSVKAMAAVMDPLIAAERKKKEALAAAVKARAAMNGRGSKLYWEGRMEYLWRLNAGYEHFQVLGFYLPHDDIDTLCAMYDGEDEGRFDVKIIVQEPDPDADFALCCPEDLIPGLRGVVLAIGKAGSGQYPVKVQLTRLPSEKRRRFLVRVVELLREDEREPRKALIAAKRAEMDQRKEPLFVNFDELTPLTKRFQLVEVPLKFMSRVDLADLDAGEKSMSSCLRLVQGRPNRKKLDDFRTTMAETLGLGSKLRKRWPHVPLGIVIGNDPSKGFVDFTTAKSLRSLRDEMEKTIEVHGVHFKGHLVRLPLRLQLGALPRVNKKLGKKKKDGEDAEGLGASLVKVMNCGRELDGLGHRAAVEFPPGVEPMSGFELKAGHSPAHRSIIPWAGLNFTLAPEVLLAMFGPLPIPASGGNIAYTTSIASADCTSAANFFLYFRVVQEGADRPWVRFPWSDVKYAGVTPQERYYEKYLTMKQEHEEAEHPFPVCEPPAVFLVI